MARIAISFSTGIRSIVGIENFIAVDAVISPSGKWTSEDDVSVLVWGRKSNTRLALSYARKHRLPVLYLEDGFIRTCSDNPHSRLTYSLIVDRKGVYYDSRTESELEQLLNASDQQFEDVFSREIAELTQACLEVIVEHNITKYNYCRDYEPTDVTDERPIVLVVDQTVGDASVTYGDMGPAEFRVMLNAAIDENPDARIIVKSHPDVLAGHRQGYLTEFAKTLGVEVLSDAVNPISVLKTVEQVYVGTSQLGMEALLCGKRVTVFGKPFYAGWGLTDDRIALPARTMRRSLLELFYAAFVWYPRYCNPITGARWTLAECLRHVVLQKSRFAENSRHFTCVGVTPWKRRYIQRYLRSPEGSVSFSNRRQLIQSIADGNCDAVATWGYRMPALRHEIGIDQNIAIYRIEDGFLRSSGLGSDYNAPASLVIDQVGMYFNPEKPSRLENLLSTAECTQDQILRARRLINLILSAKLSKYNLSVEAMVLRPAATSRRVLLVIGQVESDASIRYGCNDIRTNAALLQAVRSANPDAWIAYKPHPDVVAGNRPGSVPAQVLEQVVDVQVGDANIISCIESADELHTMTSLAGFEALLRGKSVVTYGVPFYAGWGLTVDSVPIVSRKRQRTLEELVYFSLVQYPVYLDIDTGEFASPEDIVNRIKNDQMKNKKKLSWSKRQLTKFVNVCKGMSYAP